MKFSSSVSFHEYFQMFHMNLIIIIIIIIIIITIIIIHSAFSTRFKGAVYTELALKLAANYKVNKYTQ